MWRYTGYVTITKHTPPRLQKKGRWKANNDKTNATRETTDAQTKSCNRGTTVERSVGRLLWGGVGTFYKFRLRETSVILTTLLSFLLVSGHALCGSTIVSMRVTDEAWFAEHYQYGQELLTLHVCMCVCVCVRACVSVCVCVCVFNCSQISLFLEYIYLDYS